MARTIVQLKEVPKVVASTTFKVQERPAFFGGGLRPQTGLDWQAAGAVVRFMLDAIGAAALLIAVLC